ncbi:microsomal signal peptidase 25 kDa subunit [Lichtheimia hyalospora FSU 10163]|nr:microsomal signal peptidase 25 kDa subunit [Lichtheimia hyalospora FSU 10163]
MTDNKDSTSASDNTEEPVQVTNKYDSTQLKNAIDDEVRRFFGKERDYQEGHLHTDIKLVLGYGSCLLAGGAFLFEYYSSFDEAKPVLWVSVIVFWILQAISWIYTTFVEKNEIFVGYKHDPKTGERHGIVTVSADAHRHSPLYTLTLRFQDQVHHKVSTIKGEKNVNTWFTEEGVLVKEALDKDLQEWDEQLILKMHKD